MFKIGISTKVFNKFHPKEHLRLLSITNISLIELSGNCFHILEDAEAFKNLQRALLYSKIKLNSIHVPFYIEQSDYVGISNPECLDISHPDRAARERAVKAALLCLEQLIELGGCCLVIHPSHEPIKESERIQRLEYSLESLLVLRNHLPTDGSVKIAVENMCRTILGRDSSELLALLKRVNSSHFGVCLDVNHCLQQEDVVSATKRYGSLIFSVHISDNDGVEERHWMPGKGVIRWDELAKTFLEVGYNGALIYELYPEQNCSDERIVKMISDNAKSLFGKS